MKITFYFLVFSYLISGFGVTAKPDKITGTIRSSVDNRLLANCRVTLFLNDDVFDEKITDENGAFTFFRLYSGDYQLEVELNNFKIYEHHVPISNPQNVTHSVQIYLQPSNAVAVAQVELKEYPEKSDYQHFLLNHHFKSYDTDSTILVASSGECVWNDQHELLYISVLHVDMNARGEVNILPKSKLLGTYEVVPDVKETAVAQEESSKKKWMTVLDRLSKTAEKVLSENPDMIKMGK